VLDGGQRVERGAEGQDPVGNDDDDTGHGDGDLHVPDILQTQVGGGKPRDNGSEQHRARGLDAAHQDQRFGRLRPVRADLGRDVEREDQGPQREQQVGCAARAFEPDHCVVQACIAQYADQPG